MKRFRLHSPWARWIGLECLQWAVALALFLGVPWAHYEQVLKPQLQSVQQVRATLDQEWRAAVRRNDWESWAGMAMARVQATVGEAMHESGEIDENQATPLVAVARKDSSTVVQVPVSPNMKRRATAIATKKNRKNILVRVPGSGPDDVVWTALNQFYAVPYLWGGNGIFGIDCSGLVTQVFHSVGVALPRTAQTQFDSRLGVYVGLNELKPGDLVFFHTRVKPYVSHVGIYIGNNEFVHAPRTGRRVEISSLTGYYKARFIAGKRVVADPFDRRTT